MLKYIELKTGYADNGPAWIVRVTPSKSGRTIYFNGRALKAAGGRAVAGNYIDAETLEEYWVSGVKKDKCDRLRAAAGIVWIEQSAVALYLEQTGAAYLDSRRLQLIPDLEPTDPGAFVAVENRKSV